MCDYNKEQVDFLVTQAQKVFSQLAQMGIVSPACGVMAVNLALALQYFEKEENHG